MDTNKYLQGQEMLKNALAEDMEEYHKLVCQKIETFSFKIFAGFLLSKGWTHKDSYLIQNPPSCYSCGEEIKIDEKGNPECYCNDCVPEDNPYHLTGEELKKNRRSGKKMSKKMKITKDNFYEKIEELLCSSCGSPSAEYYLEREDCPLCESCTFEALKDECNELREINDLEDENEDDVELANKLWKKQEHYHNDSKDKRSK